MLFFRWMILLSLLAAVVSFMFYAGTGQARFKYYGLIVTVQPYASAKACPEKTAHMA